MWPECLQPTLEKVLVVRVFLPFALCMLWPFVDMFTDGMGSCVGQRLTGTFNPFPDKPWFLRVCSRSLLKTLSENKKLLVTSNFSFSHSVFYLENCLPFSSNLKLSSAKSSSFEESKICRLEKG